MTGFFANSDAKNIFAALWELLTEKYGDSVAIELAPDTKTWKLQVTLNQLRDEEEYNTVFHVSIRRVYSAKDDFIVHVTFKHRSGDRFLFSRVACAALKAEKMVMFSIPAP
jgi:hypothetical protein